MKLVRREEFKAKNLIMPLILIITVINPIYESLEFKYEFLFMLSHYLLVLSGLLIGYKILRGNSYYSVLGIIPIIFWHMPLFYNLAGAYIAYRILDNITLLLGGILIGSYIPLMSTAIKLGLLVLWMAADSVLSVILIVEWPNYSNSIYPFSPWPLSQEVLTGIVMFFTMTVLFIIALVKILKS
ncbi:MAG: DUF1404 domain-containing protein, partial [Saccharolobus sp.]